MTPHSGYVPLTAECVQEELWSILIQKKEKMTNFLYFEWTIPLNSIACNVISDLYLKYRWFQECGFIRKREASFDVVAVVSKCISIY